MNSNLLSYQDRELSAHTSKRGSDSLSPPYPRISAGPTMNNSRGAGVTVFSSPLPQRSSAIPAVENTWRFASCGAQGSQRCGGPELSALLDTLAYVMAATTCLVATSDYHSFSYGCACDGFLVDAIVEFQGRGAWTHQCMAKLTRRKLSVGRKFAQPLLCRRRCESGGVARRWLLDGRREQKLSSPFGALLMAARALVSGEHYVNCTFLSVT